jgi:4-diphosphocytidyl-2-C-methyl-D-erythritol kinase
VRLVTLAPAKVNLVLRVGPPRPDGYHDLLSLMVPLDLADVVDVTVSARAGGVGCRVPGRPELDGPTNLAARAAALVKERFGRPEAVAIRIAKRIPVTAGLGGGSSDAAAVIRALARAFGIRDRAALAEVALAVGSDVPFFLGSGPAWARGRGEVLSPARVPPLDLVLAYPADPALAIRAADAYRWLDEDRGAAAPRRGRRARRSRSRGRPRRARRDRGSRTRGRGRG